VLFKKLWHTVNENFIMKYTAKENFYFINLQIYTNPTQLWLFIASILLNVM